MELSQIYRPIKDELIEVDQLLKYSFRNTKCKSILEINSYLLEAKGKRLRPALVLLSAKATSRPPIFNHSLTKVAAALEIIHTASLIHDDVIDHARLRHNKPTINSKWGSDISIALGDYLYSVAFELISQCGDKQILECISSATKAMCEGELLQVCERDNLDLLKERYIIIVKKKTASLFVASCHAGALISNTPSELQKALKEYGLNFGIAFQIIDDYLDLVSDEETIGKVPGQDIRVGEVTLPVLYLMESLPLEEKEELKILLSLKKDNDSLQRIKSRLFTFGVALKTKDTVSSYVTLAKDKLEILADSPYKESLLALADFIIKRGHPHDRPSGIWNFKINGLS